MDSRFPLGGLRQFINDTLRLRNVPGLAVAIVQDGQIVLCEGFGLRSIEGHLPATPDTLFPIASCTKAFTAMAVGLLVDAGKLDWDKPVKHYLPTFNLQDPHSTEGMTPRDLLTHRSGLPRHDLVWYASNFSRRDIFDRLRYLAPSRDLRYAFQYQNIMFIVAGLLVEEASGISWEQFVQTRIFDRLGMTHSNLSTTVTRQSSNFASPYLYHDGQLKQMPFFEADGEQDALGPAGGINSCASDMAKWLQVHLNRGRLDEQHFISESTLAEMHTPHVCVVDPEGRNRYGHEFTSYGLGWGTCSYKGQVLVQHTGGIDGFASLTSLMPHRNVGVAVLSNGESTYNPTPAIVAYTAYDRLLGLEQTDWNAQLGPFYDEAVRAEERSKAKSSAQRARGTQPSHSIESYLGDYDHPGYGVVSIRKAESQLQMVINDKLTLRLEHYHYDIFEATLEKLHYRLKLSFGTDIKGNIAQIAIQVEPMVEPVVFARVPDLGLADRSSLERFAGVYHLQKTPIRVALKGERTLTAMIQGQPEYVLDPYDGTEFDIHGLSGHSIEFKQDETGQVTHAIIIEPGMVFIAYKQQ